MLHFGDQDPRSTKFLFPFEHFCHKQLAHLGRVVLRAVVLEATVEAALLDLETRKIKKTYSVLLFRKQNKFSQKALKKIALTQHDS